MIIFASPATLQTMALCDHVIGDGTFTYHPIDFHFGQLYVLFGLVRGESVPLIHALLPDKSLATYRLFLQIVKVRLQALPNGIQALAAYVFYL